MNAFVMAVKQSGGRKKVSLLLGCTYEMVRQLEKDMITPGLELALQIQALLGVPTAYWQTVRARIQARKLKEASEAREPRGVAPQLEKKAS